MIVYPPGWGKTYIAVQIAKDYRNVVVFVPNTLVANDWCKSFNYYGLSCELINSDYTSGNDMEMIQKGDIKIINYQSYQKCKDKLVNVDFIIYDEAHHTHSKKFGKSLSLSSNKKLFLTATPKIDDEVDITIPIIDKESFRDSINKGIICDYKITSFKNLGLLETVKKLINVYNRKKILIFNGKRSGDSERKSKIFSEILNKNNIKSYEMHGGLSRNKKDKIMEEFNSEGIRVICNVNMIAEGVSIPCIDCVIFAKSRSSSIGVVQNIGRALRKHIGKKFAMIVLPPFLLNAASIMNIMCRVDPCIKTNRNMFVTDNMSEINKLFIRIKSNKSGGNVEIHI